MRPRDKALAGAGVAVAVLVGRLSCPHGREFDGEAALGRVRFLRAGMRPAEVLTTLHPGVPRRGGTPFRSASRWEKRHALTRDRFVVLRYEREPITEYPALATWEVRAGSPDREDLPLGPPTLWDSLVKRL